MRHRNPSLPACCVSRQVFFLALAAALAVFLCAVPARAEINAAINRSVWAALYNVPPGATENATWLQADDDGDGIPNATEMAAGTDPYKGGSALRITKVVSTGAGTVEFTFPTVAHKRYVLQTNSNITSPAGWADVTPAVSVEGDGTAKTVSSSCAPNTFYRIRVEDLDSDSDAVSDWAEQLAGYNAQDASTDGRVPDEEAIASAVAAFNRVTVTATRPSATQPASALTAPSETGAITVSRGLARLGNLTAPAITVSLQKAGTAAEGVDYEALPTTVSFPAGSVAYQSGGGANQVVLNVTPRFNGARRTNATAIVKALPGSGYTVGTVGSASVVLNPAGIADGTGLSAEYFQGSSANYVSPVNFGGGTTSYSYTKASATAGSAVVTATGFTANAQVKLRFSTGALAGGSYDTVYTISAANSGTFTVPISGSAVPSSGSGTAILNPPVLTRIDPAIEFAPYNAGTNPTGWGQGSFGTRGTAYPIFTNDSTQAGAKYAVRWTGQVLPQYSETYTFDFRSDDGAKVWVDGVLLVDKWAGQGAADWVNTIDLKANVLYDIRVEHFNNGGSGEARLYWWSANQPKQIVPQHRLFPAPAQQQKTTALTNSLAAVGYVGVPFVFNLSSPDIGGAGTTYSLAPESGPLPPGLTLNSTTGAITGTPIAHGSWNVAVNATNVAAATVAGSSILDITIHPTGSVTREILATNGSFTEDGVIPTLDDETDYPDNTQRRLRGYLVPPKTGNYYFWIAANHSAELWISNDSEYVNRVRRAWVSASTGKKVWNASPTQRSPWIALEAGQRYYFDVIHQTGSDADDYLAVGWCQDDIGTIPSVVGAPNPTGERTTIPNGGGLLQGYPLSGTAPNFLFQPYDYPTTDVATGALYAANLGPQGAAATNASGFANLRVEPGESPTSAVLHFGFQGLSAPRTAYHLHVDTFTEVVGGNTVVHPQGEIIFDIDDIDAFHPELRTADGGYIWHFAPVGSFTGIEQIRRALAIGKVYLNVHTTTYPGGEIRGTLNSVEGSQTPPTPDQYPEPTTNLDSASSLAHAARFLNQATFGASPADVAAVQSQGFAAWIDDQLTKPPSGTLEEVIAGLTSDINQPYPSTLFANTWWKNAITGSDQLRQRLAFALSEILVVSWANNTGPLANNGRALAHYYDTLLDYCLPTPGIADSGNFRGILKAVTLTPAMGLYLDMRGNQKGDLTIGRHPNENYGREILQLFSIGINRSWDDGKFILDSKADIVPVYTQPTILGFAALFTGWNYAQANQASGRLPTSFGPAADYLNPMKLVPTYHDLNAKLLLNNVITPAATGRTPRVVIGSITPASPAVITTTTAHGLHVGDTVRISNISGGAFSSPINASHAVTEVVDADSFKIAVDCTAAPTSYSNAAVTGASVRPAAFGTGGIAAITGSQSDNAGTTAPHPYDQYGLNELETAIDSIMENDNVAPYICRQLIQRLVTSEPPPGYLYRVVQKFRNNGSGVRGDMSAVIRQILLDGEARSSVLVAANPAFGKQREPMLRVTAAARAFPSESYTGTYTQLNGVNSNRLRIVTSRPQDYSNSFTVALDFRGNYTTTTPPDPYTNPTSTNYSIAQTLGIAQTCTDIASITPGTTTTITTVQPHGLASGNTVTLSGVSGTFSNPTNLNGTFTVTVTGSNSFTIPANTTRAFAVTGIAVGSPMIVSAPNHGLSSGNQIRLYGINGGSFNATMNNGALLTITKLDNDRFTVPVACNIVPTSITQPRFASNPCRVTTVTPHGLTTGDSVTITGLSGGTFTPALVNNTYTVTVLDNTSFLVPVNCTAPSTNNTGVLTGGNTLDVAATGMVNVAYTQPAGSNVLTINTTGPATDVLIPSPTGSTTTLKSKVYLLPVTVTSSAAISSVSVASPATITTTVNHGLTVGSTVTIAGVTGGTFNRGGGPNFSGLNGTHTVIAVTGNTFQVGVNCTAVPTLSSATATGTWVPMPASGVYEVQANVGSTFTVTTADTPSGPRSGNVIIPRLTSSYTAQTSNTVLQFNVGMNQNLLTGQNVWVDAPVVGNPVYDGEFTVTEIVDEDHFKTASRPNTTALGSYPLPSGSSNNVVIWPLVPPPLGRSGTVSINHSTFTMNSTEATLAQSPLNAPTVFNFFYPDYKFPGTLANNGVDSPEFQLSTDTNLSNQTNSLTNMFIGTGGGNGNLNGLSSFNNGGGSIVVDIGNYVSLAKTSDGGVPGLIDELAALLVGGPLSPGAKSIIQNFVTYRRPISAISANSPAVITTNGAHGLTTGETVAITDVGGGTFSTGINSSFYVVVTGANTFTLQTIATTPVAVNCTAAPSTANLALANVSYFPLSAAQATAQQRRDRVRAIIQLILTSAEHAVQK